MPHLPSRPARRPRTPQAPLRAAVAAAATAALAATLAGPAVAQPESGPWQAVVSRQVHLRAGPGPTYPIVAVLIPGTPVEVRGCLPQYAWCDVEVDVRRGWVHGVVTGLLLLVVAQVVIDHFSEQRATQYLAALP